MRKDFLYFRYMVSKLLPKNDAQNKLGGILNKWKSFLYNAERDRYLLYILKIKKPASSLDTINSYDY